MEVLKVTREVSYTVGKEKRKATHTATLKYEKSKLGEYTVIDLKSLKTGSKYEGSSIAGLEDGSFNGYLLLSVSGMGTIIATKGIFFKKDKVSENEFTNEATQARLQPDPRIGKKIFGECYKSGDLEQTKTITLKIGTYNPQTKKMAYAVSKSSIKIPQASVVTITKPPAKKVTVSAPTRNTGANTVTVKWSVPSEMTNGKNNARASKANVQWYLNNDTKPVVEAKNIALSTTSHTLNLASYLSRYKPSTGTALTKVTAMVYLSNAKGDGAAAKATLQLSAPRNPSITTPTQDKDTGIVSTTIKADTTGDARYLTRTDYVVDYYAPNAKGKYANTPTSGNFTGGEKTIAIDVSGRMSLTYEQYIKIQAHATSRGPAGDSAKIDSSALYVGWPLEPSISVSNCPTRGANDAALTGKKATFSVKTNATTEHPVTNVRLEKLVSVAYSKESDIPGDADWQDTGILDNGSCSAMATTVEELLPTAGNRTWVRLKSWNQFEEIFYRYSKPVQVRQLFKAVPTAAQLKANILDIDPGDDGQSAVLLIGWDGSEQDTETLHYGTEVSWSENPNAWRSTEQPKTFDVTYDDGQVTVGSKTYAHSATLHVMGLTEGETYYFRTRRYLDNEGVVTYGAYYPTDSSSVHVRPATAPSVVTLSGPDYVRRGGSAQVYWTHDSPSQQTSWRLVTGPLMRTDTDPEEVTIVPSKAKVVESGQGPVGSHVMRWTRIAQLMGQATTLNLAVMVSTGGDYTLSNAVTLRVVDQPQIMVVAPSLSAQPHQIGFTCTAECDVRAAVTAVGASVQTPTGIMEQAEGDTVWSDLVRMVWQPSQGGSTNLVTNAASKWLNADLTDDGTEPNTRTITLRPENAVSVTPEQTYTAEVFATGLDERTYELRVCALMADGTYVEEESTQWGATATFEPVEATQAVISVRTVPETGEDYGATMLPSDLVTAVLVLFEQGAGTGQWEPADEDVLPYSGTVTLPVCEGFHDEARYMVSATAIDRETGLQSDTVVSTFAVALSRKALPPSDDSSVIAMVYSSNDGREDRSAAIYIEPDANADATDVYDVYRVTPDAVVPLSIGRSSQQLSVFDKWAPFGGQSLMYRIACRTTDGDVDWTDVPYEFDEATVFDNIMRIDYATGYVELERGVSYSDAIKKNVTIRRHLDGSSVAHWDDGVTRTGSASGTLIKVYDDDAIRRLRELSRDAGPAFVRTSEGLAYEADVQVGTIGTNPGSAGVSVSVSITEVMASTYLGLEVPTDNDDWEEGMDEDLEEEEEVSDGQ